MARRSPQIDALLAEAERIRGRLPAEYAAPDRPFAAADACAVHDELVKYGGRGLAFLEWGSGIGTIAIMAGLMGYQSFGIEIDSKLMGIGRELAAQFGGAVRFVEGNFLPLKERAGADSIETDGPLRLDGADAYALMGRALNTFDVVFVFPWPDQVDWCHAIFARHARVGARLLVYSQTMDVLEAVKTESGCSPLRPA